MLTASSFLALFGAAAQAQSPVRMAAQAGDVPPRLAARIAEAVASAWGVDTAGLVLSWGTGS